MAGVRPDTLTKEKLTHLHRAVLNCFKSSRRKKATKKKKVLLPEREKKIIDSVKMDVAFSYIGLKSAESMVVL